MKPEQAVELRRPFERSEVGIIPKPYTKESPKGRCDVCGGWHGLPAVHLDYVGHAAVTDRLLKVDPEWSWEPVAFDAQGLPALDANGGLWIRLTVCGVTRLGYGHADGKRGGDAVKESIGDALRNAAMRFGVALDLWSKEDLQPGVEKASDDLPKDEPKDEPKQATAAQIRQLNKLLSDCGLTGEPAGNEVSSVIGRRISGPTDLSTVEASKAIDHFKGLLNGPLVPNQEAQK